MIGCVLPDWSDSSLPEHTRAQVSKQVATRLQTVRLSGVGAGFAPKAGVPGNSTCTMHGSQHGHQCYESSFLGGAPRSKTLERKRTEKTRLPAAMYDVPAV